MKRRIRMFLGMLGMIGLLTACSTATKGGEAENQVQEQKQTVESMEVAGEKQKENEIITISDTVKEFRLYRNNLKVYGQLHMPQGEGPFPVVVMASGFDAKFDYQMDYVELLNEKGIAAVIFDFTGIGTTSFSDGEPFDRTMPSNVADLNMVLDEALKWPELDSSKLFLWGHSFGGLVSADVAGERGQDIQGLILLEPSFFAPDLFREVFPEGAEIPFVMEYPLPVGREFAETIRECDIFESMEKYQGEVLIFQGTVHSEEDLEEMDYYYGKALETYPSARLLMIEGANHFFEGEAGLQMTEQAIEFIENILEVK